MILTYCHVSMIAAVFVVYTLDYVTNYLFMTEHRNENNTIASYLKSFLRSEGAKGRRETEECTIIGHEKEQIQKKFKLAYK